MFKNNFNERSFGGKNEECICELINVSIWLEGEIMCGIIGDITFRVTDELLRDKSAREFMIKLSKCVKGLG